MAEGAQRTLRTTPHNDMSHIDKEHKRLPPSLVGGLHFAPPPVCPTAAVPAYTSLPACPGPPLPRPRPRPRAGSDGPAPGVLIEALVTSPATAPVAPPRRPRAQLCPRPLAPQINYEIDLRGAGIMFIKNIGERPLQFFLTLFEVPNK